MKPTGYESYSNEELPRGCQLCVKGKKLVLFITGVCTKSCYFCPLSEKKFHKDVIYANERPINELKEIIEEAKISSAQGAGITGGDPLTKLDRTLEAIKLLKQEFKNFHIHLYTPLDLVTEDILKQLEEAGLDEIRFHPDLDDNKLWHKIKFKTNMSKGIEIPCIPNKDLKKLIEFAKNYVEFFNLNELEYADATHNKLAELGYETKDEFSYGVKGSEETALKILNEFPDLKIHYCTTRLKDSVQMMNRIKLRAKNAKRSFDILTTDGTLIRGSIKGNENLEEMHKKVSKYFDNEIDPLKNRLLCAKNNVKKFSSKLKQIGYKLEIVEELATYDQFEIESEEI
jgi:pyruvate formate-lyase activating enzyme-like uncharacterized protein